MKQPIKTIILCNNTFLEVRKDESGGYSFRVHYEVNRKLSYPPTKWYKVDKNLRKVLFDFKIDEKLDCA
jgi:hypothetical protein